MSATNNNITAEYIADSDIADSYYEMPIKPPKLIKRPGSTIEMPVMEDGQIYKIRQHNEILSRDNYDLQQKITALESRVEELMNEKINVQQHKTEKKKKTSEMTNGKQKPENNINNVMYNVEVQSKFNELPLSEDNVEMISDDNSSVEDESNTEFIPVLRRQNRKKNINNKNKKVIINNNKLVNNENEKDNTKKKNSKSASHKYLCTNTKTNDESIGIIRCQRVYNTKGKQK